MQPASIEAPQITIDREDDGARIGAAAEDCITDECVRTARMDGDAGEIDVLAGEGVADRRLRRAVLRGGRADHERGDQRRSDRARQ